MIYLLQNGLALATPSKDPNNVVRCTEKELTWCTQRMPTLWDFQMHSLYRSAFKLSVYIGSLLHAYERNNLRWKKEAEIYTNKRCMFVPNTTYFPQGDEAWDITVVWATMRCSSNVIFKKAPFLLGPKKKKNDGINRTSLLSEEWKWTGYKTQVIYILIYVRGEICCIAMKSRCSVTTFSQNSHHELIYDRV